MNYKFHCSSITWDLEIVRYGFVALVRVAIVFLIMFAWLYHFQRRRYIDKKETDRGTKKKRNKNREEMRDRQRNSEIETERNRESHT